MVKTFRPVSSSDLLPLCALCFTQPRGSLVVKSCLILCDPMNCSMPGFPVLHYLPKFAQTHVHCHPTISSSVTPFYPRTQSFPASGSFPMSWLFVLIGQGIGASTSTPVLPVSIQGWFTLRLIGLISLLSKGLSRVFSSFQREAGRQRNQRSNCQHMLDPRKTKGIPKEHLLLIHWLH